MERKDGPPVDLVIRRDLVPLFKESRKIDAVFAVINAAEEAPGEIRINGELCARNPSVDKESFCGQGILFMNPVFD
jgi:hypothetical protein